MPVLMLSLQTGYNADISVFARESLPLHKVCYIILTNHSSSSEVPPAVV